MNPDDLSFGAPEPLTTEQAAEMRPEVAPEPDSFRAFAQFWGHACAIFAAVAVCLES